MSKVDGLARVRAWWFRRQGLSAGGAPKTVAGCLARAGWLPTAGSTGVYLSMRARLPGLSRETLDRAAMDGVDVVEVPGAHARPPVLVPRDELALACRLHHASYSKHVAPLFASGRYSESAFKAVAAQACAALDEGPLATAEIRAAVTHPEAAELLTGALIDLAVRGIIRRFPADGRLDSSKYLYELRHPDDRPNLEAEGDAEAVALKATRLFLRRHGPASSEEIADWAALTKGSVRKALAALRAERIAIRGWTEDVWLLEEDVGDWKTFAADEQRVVCLPYRDPFVYVRRPAAVLARHKSATVLNTEDQPAKIATVRSLNHHTIVVDGEVAGMWEYDLQSATVVARIWPEGRTLRSRVDAAAADTTRFIREQLGDAKRSAVDPPARRAKRIAFCRRQTRLSDSRRQRARRS